MDFNRLYSNHQLLLMQAVGAPSEQSRGIYEIAASHLAGRIGCMHRALGAAAAPAWETLAAPAPDSLASPGRHALGFAN